MSKTKQHYGRSRPLWSTAIEALWSSYKPRAVGSLPVLEQEVVME